MNYLEFGLMDSTLQLLKKMQDEMALKFNDIATKITCSHHEQCENETLQKDIKNKRTPFR